MSVQGDVLTLGALIEARGFRKDAVAAQLGLSPNSFYNRLGGRTRFTDGQIEALAEIIGVHPTITRRALPLPVKESA